MQTLKDRELLIRLDERQKQSSEVADEILERVARIEKALINWKLKVLGANAAAAGVVTFLLNLLKHS